MFGTLKGRLLITAGIVIAALAVLFTRGIDRGLDLQGGMYLSLEVQDADGTMTADVKRQHTQQTLEILRNRLDQFGVVEPTVAGIGDYRIVVELPAMTDQARARAIIEQQAFLEWKLLDDLNALISVMPRMDRAVIAAGGADVEAEAKTITADSSRALSQDVRSRFFGGRDTTGRDTTGADSAAADAPPSGQPLSSLIEQVGDGEMRVLEADVDRVKRYLALPGVRDLLPRGTELLWGAKAQGIGTQLYRPLYLVRSRAFITGDRLNNAIAGRDPQYGETIVSFELDRRGGREFEQVTTDNVGRRLAIVLDQKVHSAPVINQRIGANGQIQMGQSPMDEARDLATVLRAGALAAPIEIMELRNIGPSLGQDSIDQGKIAGMVGVVLVIVIMIGYYRIAGVLAVVALAIYVLLLLAGLSALGAALTAPGIAGIILSLGMAVDANVLIFERIREELRLGRTVRLAVDNGFREAMSAIIDSNLTTLITAFILFQIGTGPVQGFAVTLSIGIIASFFSAVFVTRTFFMLYLDRRRSAGELSI